MDLNEFSAGPDDVNPFGANPFGVQPAGAPTPYRYTRLSVLGIFSMITGIVSPFLCCVCYLSIFSSLTAVITGHLSLAEIKRSGGTVTGTPFAVVGLVFGYPMLLLSLGMIGFVAYNAMTGGFDDVGENEISSSSSGEQALHDAEMKILGDSQGTAHGNTEEAEDLAADFSERMKVLRESLFTDDDRKIQITGGEFLTYCELHDDRVLFLVHVPAYRDFEDDAKDQLAALAWRTAQNVIEDTLLEGDRLAIGMKGTFLYGSVMVGTVGSDEPNSTGTDADRLIDFFPAADEFDFDIRIPLEDGPDEPASAEPEPDVPRGDEAEPFAEPAAA